MVAIGEYLGDIIQRGRGRGERGYLDKQITQKLHSIVFSHFGKPYSMYRMVLIVVLSRYLM